MEQPLDRTVRAALEPSSDAVERLVARALDDSPEVSGTPRRRLLAAAAVVAVAIVLGAFVLSLLAPRPAPQIAEMETPATASRVTITNLGEMVVVRSPDRATSLHSRSAPDRSPQGMRLIVLQGNQP